MRTFYFNTGVRPWNSSYMEKGDVWINNQRHIPFDCENVPDGATFAFLCDDPNLNQYAQYLVFPTFNTTMLGSKYAYFTKPYKAI